jgi:hypothetical protein
MTTENKLSIYGENHVFDMSSYEPRAGKTVSNLYLPEIDYRELLLAGHAGSRTSIAAAEAPHALKRYLEGEKKPVRYEIYANSQRYVASKKQGN